MNYFVVELRLQHDEERRLATRSDRFSRMFDLPSFAEPTPQVQAALMELGAPGGLMDAMDPLLDRDSYLWRNRTWRPMLPSRARGTFGMADLLTFPGVDPASRRQ
jgi:hypothetical protein